MEDSELESRAIEEYLFNNLIEIPIMEEEEEEYSDVDEEIEEEDEDEEDDLEALERRVRELDSSPEVSVSMPKITPEQIVQEEKEEKIVKKKEVNLNNLKVGEVISFTYSYNGTGRFKTLDTVDSYTIRDLVAIPKVCKGVIKDVVNNSNSYKVDFLVEYKLDNKVFNFLYKELFVPKANVTSVIESQEEYDAIRELIHSVSADPVPQDFIKTLCDSRQKQAREALEEFYDTSWDLNEIPNQVYKNEPISKYSAIIYFDKFTLSNSNKQTHDITDLYIVLYFDKYMNHTSSIWGHRGTVSFKEANVGYRHSHLVSRNHNAPTAFCLGDNTIMSNLCHSIRNKWDIVTFKKILVNLYSYSAWESIEGGPYMKMENIHGGTRSRVTLSNRQVMDHTKLLLRKLTKSSLTLPITYNERSQLFELSMENEEFNNFMTTNTDVKVVYSNGSYYSPDSNANDVQSFLRQFNSDNKRYKPLYYKGNVVHTIGVEVQEAEANCLVIHPTLKTDFCTVLQDKINSYYLILD